MSWQLLLAFIVTVPALLMALALVALVLWRRRRILQQIRHSYMTGPRHIAHATCQCFYCRWERKQESFEFIA